MSDDGKVVVVGSDDAYVYAAHCVQHTAPTRHGAVCYTVHITPTQTSCCVPYSSAVSDAKHMSAVGCPPFCLTAPTQHLMRTLHSMIARYAVDAEEGELLWDFKAEDKVIFQPARLS